MNPPRPHLLLITIGAFLGAGAASLATLWFAGFFPPVGSAGGSQYCNVLRLPVYGTIVTFRPPAEFQDPSNDPSSPDQPPVPDTSFAVSGEIEDSLRMASTDPNIKALLVDVDSGGGGAVAGLEIAAAIKKFGKPSAAVIHELGASSGYLVATAADILFASEASSVGSIGTTYSYVSQYEKNKKEGYKFESLSSGPYKDMFSADKPLTDAERALIMRDIKIDRDNFVKRVAEYRHQPVEKIDALADGSSMLGEQALENGLIDRLGGTEEALSYLEQAIGEPPVLCY